MTHQKNLELRNWLVYFAYTQYPLYIDEEGNCYYLEPAAVELSYDSLLKAIVHKEGGFAIKE